MYLRKLVTPQVVKAIIPIKGADRIELAQVMGWQCVVNKGEFKPGDIGVYYEVDSYLPIEERYEFLRKATGSHRNVEYLGEGFRIKTITLRGCISQGLLLSLESVPEAKGIAVGTDISELLRVQKWYRPETETSDGTRIGSKPYGIPTTDELRAQSMEVLVEKLQGKPYYIATKMDGTSCTMYQKDGIVGVCGRNDEFADDENCAFWQYAHKHDIPNKLKSYGLNLALQGEYCGHGINKNRLRLLEPEYYIFDIVDLDTNRRMDYYALIKIAAELGLKTVPIEEVGESFNYTLEQLIQRAKGKYPSGLDKEGIVVRSKVPEYVQEAYSRLSFKVLNNDFLGIEE